MYSIVDKEENEQENDNEKSKLSEINVIEFYNSPNKKNRKYYYVHIIMLFVFITIFLFCVFFFISYKFVNIIYEDKTSLNKDNIKNQEIKEKSQIQHLNSINLNEQENNKNIINNTINNIIEINDSTKENKTVENKKYNQDYSNNKTNKEPNKKIGLAFVYSTLLANGIARFITLTANHFMKTGKYDICLITSNPSNKDYSYNNKIKRFIAYGNYTLIRNITKYENIDFFILQNVISRPDVDFYRSLGKKVIGIFHGVFMSPLTHGSVGSYRSWIDFDYFDSYIFIAADDYYFYKKLGFKNEIYIPNLYTFEPSETPNSNLTYNNIISLGRQNDQIKGTQYAVKTMKYIVKEIPDAKLTLVTSDSRIQFLKNLTKELNLTNNVFINYHTYNISSYFLNSSIHMYTSISEAFPMALNEGKAHGLPIVAFDVPYSPPYQDGVIVVDQLDCEALARETILLLKNYTYRKKMGQWAKNSLNTLSNKETIELWEKLFRSLLSNDINDYRNLQNEVEKKYYNEESARKHMKKHFDVIVRINQNFSCHYLENLTDINYIKNIKECAINNTNITKN